MKLTYLIYSVLFFICISFATDGYFSSGYGTKNKGFAGAGTAYLNSSSSVIINPAGVAFINKQGFSFEVGVSLFNPNRDYTITGNPTPPENWGYIDQMGNFVADGRFMAFGLTPGKVESENSLFFVPTLSATYVMGANTFGLNIYGNGGMNTEYDTRTFYSAAIDQVMSQLNPAMNPMANVAAPTGVNLEQLFVSLTYSRKLTDKHALGISPIFAYQTFEATGLQAFRDMGMAGNNSAYVTNNDKETSTGFGFKAGYQGELFENFRAGLAYQSKIVMSEFDDYKGLFAEAGDFDIPASWNAGVSYSFNRFTVMADVKQIMYSDIKAINNGLNPQEMAAFIPDVTQPPASGAVIPNPNFVPLGDENGAGFGWDDITVFKIGIEFKPVEDWTLRSGFSTGDQPIPEETVMFNILAPAVNENHISFGASKLFGENELSFAVTHAFSNSVKGTNPFDPAQTIEIEMDQWDIELGFSF